jgi:hypothetical protein
MVLTPSDGIAEQWKRLEIYALNLNGVTEGDAMLG